MKLFSKTLYHATPNDFDKFDTEHIGSGEGQQVHGWGLYFAADRNTVELFYTDLKSIEDTYSVIELDGEVLEVKGVCQLSDVSNFFYVHGCKNDVSRRKISEMIYFNKQLQKLSSTEKLVYEYIDFWIKENKDNLKGENNPRLIKYIQENLDDYNYLKEFLQQHNFKYHVHKNEDYIFEIEINDDLRFIDETAIFYDPEYNQDVKSVLEKIASEYGDNDLFGGNMKYSTFYSIYQYLSQLMNGDKNVSLALEKYGVNGIHYYGERDGECYVIFNPENITIVKKEKR